MSQPKIRHDGIGRPAKQLGVGKLAISRPSSEVTPPRRQELGLPDLSVSGEEAKLLARSPWCAEVFLASRTGRPTFHPGVAYEIGQHLRGRCAVGTTTPTSIFISFGVQDNGAANLQMVEEFATITAGKLGFDPSATSFKIFAEQRVGVDETGLDGNPMVILD